MLPNSHKMRILRHRTGVFRDRIIRFNKESIHRGAPRPCGARPNAAPMLSLLDLIILSLNTPVLCLSIRILLQFGNILRIIVFIHYFPIFCEQAFISQTPVGS